MNWKSDKIYWYEMKIIAFRLRDPPPLQMRLEDSWWKRTINFFLGEVLQPWRIFDDGFAVSLRTVVPVVKLKKHSPIRASRKWKFEENRSLQWTVLQLRYQLRGTPKLESNQVNSSMRSSMRLSSKTFRSCFFWLMWRFSSKNKKTYLHTYIFC